MKRPTRTTLFWWVVAVRRVFSVSVAIAEDRQESNEDVHEVHEDVHRHIDRVVQRLVEALGLVHVVHHDCREQQDHGPIDDGHGEAGRPTEDDHSEVDDDQTEECSEER